MFGDNNVILQQKAEKDRQQHKNQQNSTPEITTK